MTDRDDVRQRLPAHVLGELPADQAADVEAALRTDAELAREATELRVVLAAVAGADHEASDTPAEPLDEELTGRIVAAVGHARDDVQPADGRPSARNGVEVDPAGADGRPTIISVSSAHLAAAPLGHGAPEPGVRRGRRSAVAPASDPGDEATAIEPARPRIDRGALRWSRIAIPVAAVLLAVVVILGITQGAATAPGVGVSEDIAFAIAADVIEVDARLVPHPWGTEVFLTVTGTTDGVVHRVDLEDRAGQMVAAGTFIGAGERDVVSVMNGAVLREDAVAVVVTTADGAVVMRAELDAVAFTSD